MADTPQRPPWFREPPRKGDPLRGTTGTDSAAGGGQHGGTPPLNPSTHPSSPLSEQKVSTTPASENRPEQYAGRFPIRPDPPQPPPSPPSPPVQREASLDARMLALEHDYARSAESWRESSLAVVRALEILESRVGAQTGQVLGGMGEGEISNQLTALRADMAQLRNRIDGFLPPPRDQVFTPPQSLGGGFANPTRAAPLGGSPRAQVPLKPAKIKRTAGRGFLSLLITIAAVILAWYAATYMNDLRDQTSHQDFYQRLHPATQPMAQQPKTALEHYSEAVALYRQYRVNKVEENIHSVVRHFQIAADAGMAAAQFWLGFFHEKGEGLPRSSGEAARLYQQAAHMGHVKAMHHLGMMYLEGRGVVYDIASASEWLLKAAGYGYAESMNQLGYISEEGILGTRNIIHAYAWYKLAARLGHKDAMAHAPRLAISLSTRNRREAAALIASWRIREADPTVNGAIDITKRVGRKITLIAPHAAIAPLKP